MRIFRKLILSLNECQWFAGYYDDEAQVLEYEPINAEDVSAKLAELETAFPHPSFSAQYGYGFEHARPCYVFDRGANPN